MSSIIKLSTTKISSKFIGLRSLHHFNHTRISQEQLQHSIQTTLNGQQRTPRESWRNFLQISSLILLSTISTIGLYSTYQAIYKNEKTFIPLWINPHKRSPKSGEIDIAQVQAIAEEQILERLSLDDQIKQQFKLPIKQDPTTTFEVWVEDRYTTLKGFQISPDQPIFSIVNKPIKIRKIFDQFLEPIGGIFGNGDVDEKFKIPVYNEHTIKEKDYEIVFLGEIPIRGQNGKEAQVVFKGVFDFEHVKHAKILKAHLIVKNQEGKLERKVLWG